MKFKHGKWLIDSRSLVEFKKEGILPKLYVHEKFETILKVIVWTIGIAGFITIFLSIDNYYISVSIGLFLFLLSFVFDRAIVKYSSMVLQPLPDFDIDYSEWKNVMTVSYPDYKTNVNFVGLVYKNLEYGIKFFSYLRRWNNDKSNDSEGNIIFSIIEEPNGSFTFYIYANPARKSLKELHEAVELENFKKKAKKDKVHEQLVMEMSFWRNTKYASDEHMRDFFHNQPKEAPFMLVPTEKEDQGYAIDLESQIILSGYKYAKRSELTEFDRETQLSEMEERWDKKKKK
jgi:hypothetical protein